MTEFQRKTLQEIVKITGIAITTVAVVFGIIVLMAYSAYVSLAIMGIIILSLFIGYFVRPLVKDWKLRGRLSENEYGIYQSYKSYLTIGFSEQRAKETLCAFHNLMIKDIDEIIEKAERKN